MPKRRIYKVKRLKIKVKERELRACECQNPKMYEHVGMANNHHKHRSDEWQITPSFDHNNKNKESSKAITQRLKVQNYKH